MLAVDLGQIAYSFRPNLLISKIEMVTLFEDQMREYVFFIVCIEVLGWPKFCILRKEFGNPY